MTAGRDRTAAVFAALGDPTRREVIRFLSAEGPVTATGLASRLPVTRQAVSKHLAALAEAGLVSAERHGREVQYRLRTEPLTAAMGWMADVGAEWDKRLSALRKRFPSRGAG